MRATTRWASRLGLTACAFGLAARIGLGATLHVASGGGNTSPYDTWAKAATDLKTAVDLANSYNNGSTVRVSNGTYTAAAEIAVNNTVVRGCGNRAAVVVDGGGAVRPFFLNHVGAVLADLTVSNGLATSGSLTGNGGGVYLNVAGSLLTNCVVTHCTAAGSGGGVYLNKGLVRGCLIACNTANGTAARTVGGIQANTDMKILDCVVSNNTALNTQSAIGGAYLLTRGVISNSAVIGNTGVGAGGVGTYYYALLANCRILDNSASNATASVNSGGGVHTGYSTTLRNCLLAGNVCRAVYRGAGGIQATKQNSDGGSLAVEACTITSNRYYRIGASGTGAGGAYLVGTNCLIDCVVYGNTSFFAATWNDMGMNSSDRFNTNNYFNNCVRYAPFALPLHLNNTTSDPLFAGPNAGDYRLTKHSPCINAGTNLPWMNGATDLAGAPRLDPISGRADMGCHEFQEGVVVDPARYAIVLPDTTVQAQLAAAQFSAEELQRHIEWMTGVKVAIHANDDAVMDKYRFYVGNRAAFPVPQTAQWIVGAEATWFTGSDAAPQPDLGSRFAIYGFLEDQWGVRWIEPGDGGALYPTNAVLLLTPGTNTWQPQLELRKLRADAKAGSWAPIPADHFLHPFTNFWRTEAAYYTYATNVVVWQARMRMGSYTKIAYGHAFTTWWETYGATHPEYFALNKYGNREPEVADATQIKLCVSNPDVVARIVSDWQAKGKPEYLNVCVNDGHSGYCRCDNCLALDAPEAGEAFGEHLTDREVYFASQVAIAARSIRPDVKVVMYAYDACMQPPRVQMIETNVVVVAVPTSIKTNEMVTYYRGWKAAGATTMGLRPNTLLVYENAILPTGSEKQIYDSFQAACTEGGIVLADFDSLTGLWKPNGMAFYILAKAMSDPSRAYDYWEDEYCAAFGQAAADVKAYYTFWRNHLWEARLLPDLDAIIAAGNNSFALGLYYLLGTYYDESDFDTADALLQAGAGRTLTDRQRAKLDQMILAVAHARMAYRAMTHYGDQAQALDLIDYRIANQTNLTEHNWIGTFYSEVYHGDRSSQVGALRTREQLDYYDSQQYEDAIVTNNLAGWWRFEEASGTLRDATPHRNDATYNGTLYRQPGRIGRGLGFDGVDDTADCGNAASLQLTNNFTVEAWVMTGQAGRNQGIVGKQVTSATGGWSLVRMNNNRFSALISNPSGCEYVDSIFFHPATNWYHLAMVVANGTTRLYVDGVEQLDVGTRAIAESGLNLVIGKWYPLFTGSFFKGTLDEVRVYGRPLTGAEINQNFRHQRPRFVIWLARHERQPRLP